jgi:DNA (cytosine-5)-methyltransferase 1
MGQPLSVDLRSRISSRLTPSNPSTRGVLKSPVDRLPVELRNELLWWNMPMPKRCNCTFASVIEENPTSVVWRTPQETRQLLDMISPVNLSKVNAAKRAGRRMVGGVYRRARRDENGAKAQRAEVRFDDVAGGLRTPSGGSSRPTILVIDGERVRARLISARETAWLMGLGDDYVLPSNYNEAYHLTGDGLAVPVVRHVAHYLLEPLLGMEEAAERAAA